MSRPKPGAGWKHLGGAVYEHSSGARVHTGGLVRLPGPVFYELNTWPASWEMREMIRVCGGNRKRGLMAFAVSAQTN